MLLSARHDADFKLNFDGLRSSPSHFVIIDVVLAVY